MLEKAQKHLISDILQFTSKYRKNIFLISTQVHNTGYKIMKPAFVLYKQYSKSAPPCICYSCWKEIEEQLGPELLAGLAQLFFSCPRFISDLVSNWLTNKVFRAVQEKQYSIKLAIDNWLYFRHLAVRPCPALPSLRSNPPVQGPQRLPCKWNRFHCWGQNPKKNHLYVCVGEGGSSVSYYDY